MRLLRMSHDHCVEFFSDACFSRICSNERCFHGQEDRKRNQFRFRVNSVAESDVDLHWNPRSGQLGLKLDAHAIVLVIFFDSGTLNRFAGEDDAVFFMNPADRSDRLLNFADSGSSLSE
jgi:hypothetical protein